MIIYDLDLPALTNLLQQWDEPAYRAKQVWQGLYQHLYNSPDEFTNLSKSLREKLAERLNFSPLKVKLFQILPMGKRARLSLNCTMVI